MTEQLSLFLTSSNAVENPLVSALRGQGWVTAKRLSFHLGTSDRLLRAFAEQSQGEIISGQKGYKLSAEATLEEIDHAANWLISQGKKMLERGIEIRRRAHQKLK
jgi:hypothetical protein